jgi:hypothetical protein
VQLLEDQDQPAPLHVLVRRGETCAGSDLLQHVVEAGEREVGMLGEDALAGGIELLAGGAKFRFQGFGRIREGEGIEDAALYIHDVVADPDPSASPKRPSQMAT